MWRKKTGLMAAAVVLSAGLTVFADEEPARRAATEAPTTEQRQREARESSERERREDQEAAERERRRDQETRESERRRDEDNARDEERRQPQPPRGRKRRGGMEAHGPDEMMEQMMGGMPGRGMMGMMPGMMGMAPGGDWLRETDPEMFELEQLDRRLDRESHELAEHYRRTPQGPAREEIRGKLREVVTRHFKARQERRELEVKRIEAQLDRLRGALERRSKEADAIIDRRMSQMLGEEDADF